MFKINNQQLCNLLLKSEQVVDSVYSIEEILQWIDELNNKLIVNIKKIALDDCLGWYYDAKTGVIRNKDGSFFTITGLIKKSNNTIINQPILIQDEIGYLGIICSQINGVLHFLMQAKIEPGNINCIQLSPTIQATKSNFMRKHGGKTPAYFQHFTEAPCSSIIVDQIQSEQSSRFLGKRNRNTIIYIDDYRNVEVLPSHRWMTLGQIRKLMKIDNIVNMDSRTVLSCLPYSSICQTSPDPSCSLLNSVFKPIDYRAFCEFTKKISDYKMFDNSTLTTTPLLSLKDWGFKDNAFECNFEYPFRVIFCDIEIEGREVRHWHQPLFEALGIATFGLIYCDAFSDNIRRFLCKITPEIGAFDKIELGPTIQSEVYGANPADNVTDLFYRLLTDKSSISFDSLLSEEGGSFYHEQNRNIIVKANLADLPDIPNDYIWLDYATISALIRVNNQVNIQLRNLISLIEVKSDKI